MSTRKFIHLLATTLGLSVAASACAGDFSMSGSMLVQAGSMDTVRNVAMEPSSRSALGADSSSLAEMRGGDVDSAIDEPVATRATSTVDTETMPTTPAAAARSGMPSAAPAVPNRARSSNRWQSLVPGAIK